MLRFFSADEPLGVLSNFWRLRPAPLVYSGETYATSEHLYQAMKFMGDGASAVSLEFAEVIRLADTPYKAKLLAGLSPAALQRYDWQRKLAATIGAFLTRDPQLRVRADWNDDTKLRAMAEVLTLKFDQNLHARTALLNTGYAQLVEASPYDAFWGEGRAGKGKNWLGHLLVEMRAMYRKWEDVQRCLGAENVTRERFDACWKTAKCSIACEHAAENECSICGIIICGEPLHFHRDGCPACDCDNTASHCLVTDYHTTTDPHEYLQWMTAYARGLVRGVYKNFSDPDVVWREVQHAVGTTTLTRADFDALWKTRGE